MYIYIYIYCLNIEGVADISKGVLSFQMGSFCFKRNPLSLEEALGFKKPPVSILYYIILCYTMICHDISLDNINEYIIIHVV